MSVMDPDTPRTDGEAVRLRDVEAWAPESETEWELDMLCVADDSDVRDAVR